MKTAKEMFALSEEANKRPNKWTIASEIEDLEKHIEIAAKEEGRYEYNVTYMLGKRTIKLLQEAGYIIIHHQAKTTISWDCRQDKTFG